MKTVLNVGIGGRSFVIDEDAYNRLACYLENFKSKLDKDLSAKEIMNDLEIRIAELLNETIKSSNDVVTLKLINSIIATIGMPDGSQDDGYNDSYRTNYNSSSYYTQNTRKFYRDPDEKVLGGVCSGLAAYFNIDILPVRLAFLIAVLFGTFGFWVYMILWIVAPMAQTAAQKCEMRGLPVTAENISRFSGKYR